MISDHAIPGAFRLKPIASHPPALLDRENVIEGVEEEEEEEEDKGEEEVIHQDALNILSGEDRHGRLTDVACC